MSKGKILKVNVEPILFPTAVLVAKCPVCETELARLSFNGYHDYNNKRSSVRKKIRRCSQCKAVFSVSNEKPTWERTKNGDLIAECLNGDFLVWKYGNAYKWRYRTYGKQYADEIFFARTKEEAQRACERHKEWRME